MTDDGTLTSFNREIDRQIYMAKELYEETKHQSFRERADELIELKQRINNNVVKTK